MSELSGSKLSGVVPDALKQPLAALAIATTATLAVGELAGCSDTAPQQQPIAVSVAPPTIGPRVQEVIPPKPNQPAQSANIWAGYVALTPYKAKYTSVHGTFTIPTVVCNPTSSESAGNSFGQWVGLDGWGNGTVEQIGVTADCIDKNAPIKKEKGGPEQTPVGPHDFEPFYYAWWMNYGGGDYSQTLKFPVHPGDRITASVTYAGGKEFDMELDNLTTQQTYKHASTCTVENKGGDCQRAMADWIIERTGNGSMAEFGTATFEDSTATISSAPGVQKSISEVGGFPVNMVQQGQELATTSGLSPDGQSFSVFYKQHGRIGD